MPNQENHSHRQSIRLQKYDYAQPGAYFVTIVSQKRMNIFGEIVNGEMHLNQVGQIVKQTWLEIPEHFPKTSCEIFVVMPNHVHVIIQITEYPHVGATHESPLPDSPLPDSTKSKSTTLKPQTLGATVGLFKSSASKCIHRAGLMTDQKIWQRNYYEHVIRDDDDFQKITDYIETNPTNWEYDHENPTNTKLVHKITSMQ